MPVMGSSLDLSWVIVHDGVMRRSEEEAVEVMRRGISLDVVMGVCMLTGAGGKGRVFCQVWFGEVFRW